MGTTFDTTTMCWSLPAQKTANLLKLLGKAAEPDASFSLHNIEVLHGRLVHFSQLARPILLFADEVIQFLKALLAEHENSTLKERKKISAPIPPSLKYDCRVLYTIASNAFQNYLFPPLQLTPFLFVLMPQVTGNPMPALASLSPSIASTNPWLPP